MALLSHYKVSFCLPASALTCFLLPAPKHLALPSPRLLPSALLCPWALSLPAFLPGLSAGTICLLAVSQAEKSVLEIQGQELHRKLGVLEEEVRVARQSQEETRGQQQALLRDHEALAQLQRRQETELEGLLVRHRDLKANMRALELAHRELQGR